MRKDIYAPTSRSALTDRLFMYLEKRPSSDRLVLKLVLLALFVSTIWFVIVESRDNSISVSANGGTLTEGIVGTPRFINPVLAVTRADKDLTALLYDGLMSLSTEGTLEPNIAQSVTISEDGLTYNVVLRDDVTYHDGKKLTADDVVFTIQRIQDPALTSPLRASFEGVTVESLGEYELNFILSEAYAPFIENLTVGIIPRHVWKDATDEEFPFSQLNSEPIGAGPYKVKRILRNTSGIPETYILEPFEEHFGEVAKLRELILNFYSNEELLIEDFNVGIVDAVAGLSTEALQTLTINEDTHQIVTTPLPRTFAVFFNQNKSSALQDSAARKALNAAIDREDLVNVVLGGYANPIYSPIPPGYGLNDETIASTTAITPPDEAQKILKNGGWSIDEESDVWTKVIDDVDTPLAISISTANNALFESTAEYLREKWGLLGAQVTVKQFEQSDLTQAIIRPRDYETLLFGTDVGRSLDFYSFWHSSQRNDPGLNVALYANITTDSILSEARSSASSSAQAKALVKFTEEIDKETPAVFLFSPEFIYVFPKKVSGTNFERLAEAQERFVHIEDWYIDTESIWPLFEN